MIAGILIAILILGVSAWFFGRKFKRAQKREEVENQFTERERLIVDEAKERINDREKTSFTDEEPPIVMVRSSNQPIPHYSSKTWDEVEKEFNMQMEAFWSPELETVFIRTYLPRHPIEKARPKEDIVNLVVHELHHAAGYSHGENMKKAVKEVQSEILTLINE
mgnify:CR=1 FL=1